jgi:hypothetical protein
MWFVLVLANLVEPYWSDVVLQCLRSLVPIIQIRVDKNKKSAITNKNTVI